jgi:biopolymer transport protein ExbD
VREKGGGFMSEPEFSMAPLIDIVFQQLIFFMVVTTYQKTERELGVELPAAQSARAPEAAPDELVINVLRDGSIVLNGHQVQRDALAAELANAARAGRQVPVTIRGDRLAHHESVVAVMDACGVAGLSNLAVGTLDR